MSSFSLVVGRRSRPCSVNDDSDMAEVSSSGWSCISRYRQVPLAISPMAGVSIRRVEGV